MVVASVDRSRRGVKRQGSRYDVTSNEVRGACLNPSADIAIVCANCGYDLRGLASNVCPECGTGFDPTRKSPAPIPWLHRRSLGYVRAFLQTIWIAIVRPRYLGELSNRPIDIRSEDIERFRQICVQIAAASVVVAMLGLRNLPGIVLAISSPLVVYGFLILFSNMTQAITDDVLSRRDQTRLLRMLTCAPLALTPIVALVTLCMSSNDDNLLFQILILGAIGIVSLWLYALAAFQFGVDRGLTPRGVLVVCGTACAWAGMAVAALITIWLLSIAVLLAIAVVFA